MSPGTTHNSHPGSDALSKGLQSARHFAPEGREHIQFDNFGKLPETFLSARAQNSRRYFGPASADTDTGPLFVRSHVNQVAHVNFISSPLSVFVADDDNGMEAVGKWPKRNWQISR